MSSKINQDELKNYPIDVRMRFLLKHLSNGKTNWKAIEERTGVTAQKWQHFNAGRIRISGEMIETVSIAWPQYAFWLATGVTDEMHGHHAPNRLLAFPMLGLGTREEETGNATRYFESCSQAVRQQWYALLERISPHQENSQLGGITQEFLENLFKPGINMSLKFHSGIDDPNINYFRRLQRLKEMEFKEIAEDLYLHGEDDKRENI